MQVNILDAKNRLSELIKSAQAGQDVVIANRGQPVVRLVPTSAQGEPQIKRNLLDWLNNNPLPNHSKKSGQAIDKSIEEERGAWD